MSIEVEVSLRIPRVTLTDQNQRPQVIDNSSVRFAKLTSVPAIPKPGVALELTIGSDRVFQSTVTRAEWNEERERFVISCSYSKRSMTADEYEALVSDSDWKVKQLL